MTRADIEGRGGRLFLPSPAVVCGWGEASAEGRQQRGASTIMKRGRQQAWQLWQVMHGAHANSSASQWWILKSWPHIPLAPVCDRRIKIFKKSGRSWEKGSGGTWSGTRTASQKTLRKPPSPLQYFQQQSYWWLNLWGAGYGWWILCIPSMEQQRITRQTVNHLPTADKNRIWHVPQHAHCIIPL